jgi:carbon-monoxide dehydrogenase small subunit
LPFPQAAVWALMSEPARVAACLPGAFLSGQEGSQLSGGVALRFGPMQAKFEGDAVLTLMPAEQRARLQGQGRDRLSQSRAEGDIVWQVSATGEQSTRVVIEMAYSLQGPLAQFSRSGLVQEFVRRIVQQFAGNVARSLGAPAAAAGAGDAVAQSAAPSLNPVSLLWAVIWARVRRLFGARD